jgi:predicted DNA-binding antitoxin AbrB/MazE fold protein
MITVQAVYENGVLRPTEPLELTEGQKASVSVTPTPPTLSLAEWERQIRAAKTIQEWIALANACPNPGPDFDIVQAINESRRLTGFRMPDSDSSTETAR